MRLHRLVLAALTVAAAAPAAAEPITYSFRGLLSYELNGTVFDDAAVRFTLLGDTDTVVQVDDSPLVFNSAPGTLRFTLSGIDGAFLTDFNAFATTFNSGLTVIGFTQTGESDIFDVTTRDLPGYDLRSPVGPISEFPLDFLNFDTPFATTLGTLTLLDDDDNRLTVQATLGATASVPEPVTWASMTVGLGVAGGALRRRRRVPEVSPA